MRIFPAGIRLMVREYARISWFAPLFWGDNLMIPMFLIRL